MNKIDTLHEKLFVLEMVQYNAFQANNNNCVEKTKESEIHSNTEDGQNISQNN